MKLLALDTSTDYLTIAITDGAKVLGRMHKKAPRNHSSLLMPMISRLLKKTRLKLKDLDGFCMGVGPGSFTGLRIGAATVKGLAFVTGKDIAAVPTFDAIAKNIGRRRGVVCVVLDARKSKVYGCFYNSDGKGAVRRISAYLLVPADELLKKCEKYDTLYFMGDYGEKIAPLCGRAKEPIVKWHPRAESVAALGLDLFRKKKSVSAEKLEPMYIYSYECDITGR
jgi:tRNA threonylcarbamoyl adenosine modification protein YeaZ